MDDLVERWPGYNEQSWAQRFAELDRRFSKERDTAVKAICQLSEQQSARIQALETSLAEMTEDRDLWKQSEAVASEQFDKAEGRVIADVVKWAKGCYLAHYHHGNRTLRRRLFWIWTAIRWPENIPAGIIKGIATALETGEWKK